MATIETVKHICDRCGNSEEKESSGGWWPENWQNIKLNQTGASLDLCENCNLVLIDWLQKEGATNMTAACVKVNQTL